MPPKKAGGQAPNKKTVEKKKEKIIEDKTFGIKNKKGKKQQAFIKQVTNQVKFGGQQSVAKREADAYQLKKEKAEREKEKAAMDALFRPVAQVQKISAGADPKSVLCVFFKQGSCTKGDKCKFSHDLSLENKAEKRSIYVDSRDIELEEDTIDKWDTDKLEEVVKKKHTAKAKVKTEIICKHFLSAIEKGLYGWFWECPNGGDKCIYRHALPPGFVLKKHQKEQEEMQPQDAITLEELVEKEREELSASGKTLTKVTLESFQAWKKRKLKEKKEQSEKAMAKKKEAFKQGKTLGISGREMFMFNPDLVVGDDDDSEGGGVVGLPSREEGEGQEVEGVDVTHMLAMGVSSEQGVRSEGESSADQAAAIKSGTLSERGVSSVGEVSEDVAVDEKLFLEEVDDSEEEELNEEGMAGSADHTHEGVINQDAEEGVAVDESLFDVDNLQDLNLDDPAILETPKEQS